MIYVSGHKIPDSDSIISAIAVAYLLNKRGINSTAVRQGNINKESQFILDKFELITPDFKEQFKSCDLYLTDFNNYTEAPEDIKDANIVGIVDHHKLGGLSTSSPLDVWIRPVGCTCTIVKEMFDYYKISIPANLAGAMMCAILSDTVIFKSPTCTKIDTKIVKQLALIAKIEDYKALGLEMFKVKSNVLGVPMEELIKRDYKLFDMHGHKVAVGQLEVVDLAIFDKIKDELKIALKLHKKQNCLDTVLLLLTDIIELGSEIIVFSDNLEIVKTAFSTQIVDDCFWLDKCLSRKKQIIPVLEPAFK